MELLHSFVRKFCNNGMQPSFSSHSDQNLNPTCLFLDTFYDRFLANLYQQDPALQSAPFQTQLETILKTNNGDSDFYSGGLRKNGWNAKQIVINSPFMQNAWAQEHGINFSGESLILAQVAVTKPDVVYCQDMHQLSKELLVEIKKHCKLLVGQIATSIIHIPIECYDVVISSILPIVEHCRSIGITSFYVPLAFAPRVREGLVIPQEYEGRPVACSFVGSIASDMHQKRAQMLTYLAQKVPLTIWGSGIEHLPSDSILRTIYQGEAWASGLFTVLGNSKITVNCHGQVLYNRNNPVNSTDEFANNMRLYEATGMGALLVTEYRNNLVNLFELGKEIVVYRNEDECASLINYYLRNPHKAKDIALAGRERTLKEHSYDQRMKVLSDYLKRLLALKSAPLQAIDYSKISYDFKEISETQVTSGHTDAWKEKSMADNQRALVRQELSALYSGNVIPPFKTLVKIINRLIKANDKVLEIGCSSGYYYEVLSYLIAKNFSYVGVDYSAPMIEMAKQLYPGVNFIEASGDNLPFSDKQFEIVISGCILLHCPNYADHIKETARVTQRDIILSRTPISKKSPTKYYTKKAYGVETVELVFNEEEILSLFHKNGFMVSNFIVVDSDETHDRHTITYSFRRIDA